MVLTDVSTGTLLPTTIVVPCYNEASRLDVDGFVSILDTANIVLLFVDDGSTDATLATLQEAKERAPERIFVLALQPNQGKASAVRMGLLQAMESGALRVGFADADLATPPEELVRLATVASESDKDAVIGSRIAFLGMEIQRNYARHLLGRVFATAASVILDVPVYDTQCGAKFFRSDRLQRVLDEPFHSRWAFDVELLGRLIADGGSIVEVPLKRWTDVPGSTIHVGSMVRSAIDLVQIRSALARRRGRTTTKGGRAL